MREFSMYTHLRKTSRSSSHSRHIRTPLLAVFPIVVPIAGGTNQHASPSGNALLLHRRHTPVHEERSHGTSPDIRCPSRGARDGYAGLAAGGAVLGHGAGAQHTTAGLLPRDAAHVHGDLPAAAACDLLRSAGVLGYPRR